MALSEQDVVLLKRAQASGQAAAFAAPAVAPAVKIWRTVTVANPAAAVAYLNASPPQGAGEAFASDDDHGNIIVFAFF